MTAPRNNFEDNSKNLTAFQVNVNGRPQDYRVGQELNLEEVTEFFNKKYFVKNMLQDRRHCIATVSKDNTDYFLKLSTSEGISVLTRNEANWNDNFNELVSLNSSKFAVPKNIESGIYNNLFYLITEKAEGELLIPTPHTTEIPLNFINNIDEIINLAELIQNLKIPPLSTQEPADHQAFLVYKSEQWFESIPKNVRDEFNLTKLLQQVKSNVHLLNKKPRHGDFTPWHIFLEPNGKLLLIDGEHALGNGVELYDIAYFIQRVFAIVEQPEIAKLIYEKLLQRKYDIQKLKVVLAARCIGGYLDESLKPQPNYFYCIGFSNWVLGLPNVDRAAAD